MGIARKIGRPQISPPAGPYPRSFAGRTATCVQLIAHCAGISAAYGMGGGYTLRCVSACSCHERSPGWASQHCCCYATPNCNELFLPGIKLFLCGIGLSAAIHKLLIMLAARSMQCLRTSTVVAWQAAAFAELVWIGIAQRPEQDCDDCGVGIRGCLAISSRICCFVILPARPARTRRCRLAFCLAILGL